MQTTSVYVWHPPVFCVCGASWFALLSSPSSEAASLAPSEGLVFPPQTRCPPPAWLTHPAPCNMHFKVTHFSSLRSYLRCVWVTLTCSWVAAPPAELAAAPPAPPHRQWRIRRKCLSDRSSLSRTCSPRWTGRGCCRGTAGGASAETKLTGRLLWQSGCSLLTGRRGGNRVRRNRRDNKITNNMAIIQSFNSSDYMLIFLYYRSSNERNISEAQSVVWLCVWRLRWRSFLKIKRKLIFQIYWFYHLSNKILNVFFSDQHNYFFILAVKTKLRAEWFIKVW